MVEDDDVKLVEVKIIGELQVQVAMAEVHMHKFDKGDIEVTVSHMVCKILLSTSSLLLKEEC